MLYHLSVSPGGGLTGHHAQHAGTALVNEHAAATRDGASLRALLPRREDVPVRMFGRIGNRGAAHSTASGKVLLAFLPPGELDRRLAGVRLARRTPCTVTSHDRLRTELARIRAWGWAENINEAQMGFASVAAPIRNPSGEVVAALSVAGPVRRLDGDNLRRYARPVAECAAQISRRLGWASCPDQRRYLLDHLVRFRCR